VKKRCELTAREVNVLHSALKRRMGDTSVPSLPEVAVRVVQLVGDPNSSLSDFANVIKTDQALTGRLLRTANSAYYAQRAPVTQLHRATVLLGIERVKAMALGFHLSQAALQDDSGFSTKRIWSRSLMRAWLAFRLAERFDRQRAGECFIIGLMLDAGLPLMGKLIGESYSSLVSPGDAPRSMYQREFENLPFTHVDVVAALAELWRFPPDLSRPLAMRFTAPGRINENQGESILQCVTHYVGLLKIDDLSGSGRCTPMASLGVRILGIDPPEMKELFAQACADFKSSKDLFKDIIDETMSIDSILHDANHELSEVVEDLVEDAIRTEQANQFRRFEAGGLVLEVFIADGSGNRLLSEEITPAEKSSAELRQILMLDEAPDDVFEEVVGHIRQIAA